MELMHYEYEYEYEYLFFLADCLRNFEPGTYVISKINPQFIAFVFCILYFVNLCSLILVEAAATKHEMLFIYFFCFCFCFWYTPGSNVIKSVSELSA